MNEQMESGIKQEESEQEKQEKKDPFTPDTLRKWFIEQDCPTRIAGSFDDKRERITKYITQYEGITIEWDSKGNGTIDGGIFKVKEIDPNNPLQSFLGCRP